MRAAQAAEEAEAALAHADALAARAQAAAQDAALMGVAIGHGGSTNELLEHFVMKLDILVAELPEVERASPLVAQHALSIVAVLLNAAVEASRSAMRAIDAIDIVSHLQNTDPAVQRAAVASIGELDPFALAQHAKSISQQMTGSPGSKPTLPAAPRAPAPPISQQMTVSPGSSPGSKPTLPAAPLAPAPVPEMTASVPERTPPAAAASTAAEPSEMVADVETADPSAGALAEEAKAQLAVDKDGDGVPDAANALFFMVDADGDGVNDGLHSDKLGRFVPQPGLKNDRPFYVNDGNKTFSLWWNSGRFRIGLTEDCGGNRGWLRVASSAPIPPSHGWQVWSKTEKMWVAMHGLVCKEVP